MIRICSNHPFLLAAALAFCSFGAFGCESGGVGDPCIPEDEYQQAFSGYAVSEVNVESRSFQCETRVCIVNHFQGRVSCPYGQTTEDLALPPTDPRRCRVPGTDGKTCIDAQGNTVECGANPDAPQNLDQIKPAVAPQLLFRSAADTVYCSCRCKGPEPDAVYCECPSGFVCSELVRDIGIEGRGQLVGSYCIKPKTAYDPQHPPIDSQSCNIDASPRDGATNRGQTRKIGATCGVNEDGDPANPPL